MSSPSTDWAQFYQRNPPTKTANMFTTNQVSDTTTATTTVGSTTDGLSPEGRISEPIRRRSRASRRTPTTLLNTDKANFRAMVQQFTGGPLAPFASGSSSTADPNPIRTNFNFGLGSSQQILDTNAVTAPMSGYNMLQVQQQQFQQQQFMFPLNYMNDGDHHGYFQRLESSTALPSVVEVSGSGGFGVDGVSSSASALIRTNSSSAKNIIVRAEMEGGYERQIIENASNQY